MVCVVVSDLVLKLCGKGGTLGLQTMAGRLHQATRLRHEWGDVIPMPDNALEGGESQGDLPV